MANLLERQGKPQLVDLNGDGVDDLVYAQIMVNDRTRSALFAQLSDGAGQFADRLVIGKPTSESVQMNEIVFADFEGDGDVDAFELGDGSVALNSGRGQFTPFEPIGVNGLRFSAILRISTAADRVASLTTLHYDGINPVFAGSDLGNVLT